MSNLNFVIKFDLIAQLKSTLTSYQCALIVID